MEPEPLPPLEPPPAMEPEPLPPLEPPSAMEPEQFPPLEFAPEPPAPEPLPEPPAPEPQPEPLELEIAAPEPMVLPSEPEAPPAQHQTPGPVSLQEAAAEGKYVPGMTTEILADAFMRAIEVYDYGEDKHAALEFILDLALENVGAESGSVLLTDLNSPKGELWFEVARGPKADEIIKFKVPMGAGIVGFCAQEGVSLLIADVTKDPRFKKDITEEIGYEPRSILCVPIQHKGRMMGAIELINRAGGRPFTQGELSIINYLAHTAGEYLANLL